MICQFNYNDVQYLQSAQKDIEASHEQLSE
jgi:hypothetical protein